MFRIPDDFIYVTLPLYGDQRLGGEQSVARRWSGDGASPNDSIKPEPHSIRPRNVPARDQLHNLFSRLRVIRHSHAIKV